ncbi:motile sperm domain-containing protein 1-like [Oscarella lobularis]|uniref:motile sperm domain-containing protein 1-like n=1 Tax=Oscarella lobularis TaxID=121494 RepID=UPI00331337A3
MMRQRKRKKTVFLSPERLVFKETDPKATLTVYNPYDGPVFYRVLSNVPERFIVSDPEGCLPSAYRVDIAVQYRLDEEEDANEKADNKFKIDLYSEGKVLLGSKIIFAEIQTSKREEDSFRPTRESSVPRPAASATTKHSPRRSDGTTSSPFIIIIGLFCVGILIWPDPGTSRYTSFIEISTSHRLLAAYVLGLITVAIFR